MTEQPEGGALARRSPPDRPCRWCGRRFATAGVGRPPSYCRRSCRQRAYEARRRAERAGLSASDVVLGGEQLTDLRDRLYVLACALDDVDNDPASWTDGERFRHLYDAALPLRALWSGHAGPATW